MTDAPRRRASGTRPNVVLILCDDLGFSDIGCFGSEIPTPHLDDLAARGLRLTQMYNAARCCPSRASLLTGLYPTQAGMGHMTETGTEAIPGYEGRINADTVTLAEALRAAGYRTGMVGKWHVGGRGGAWAGEIDPVRTPRPTDRGFERFFGTMNGAGSYYDPLTLLDGEVPVSAGDGFYYTDAIGGWAEGYLREVGAGPDPFFLYVAHVAPHWPLHALEEDIEPHLGRYAAGWDALRVDRHDRMREIGLVPRGWDIRHRDPALPSWDEVPDPAWEDARMAVYAAQVTAVDRSVGRIVATLRALGIERDTAIVFLSDNGGCAELLPTNLERSMPGSPESFQSYGLPWARMSNTPFRRYKRWVHEGGISTPFVACWPAVVDGGRIDHSPAHIVDVMATFLDVAGAAHPSEREGRATRPPEGQSLVPVLEGRPSERVGPLGFEHEGNRAVRLGELKLVSPFGQPWELYRMDDDRTETVDLSARYPRDVRRLESLYGDWAQRTGVRPWEVLSTELPYWAGTAPLEG